MMKPGTPAANWSHNHECGGVVEVHTSEAQQRSRLIERGAFIAITHFGRAFVADFVPIESETPENRRDEKQKNRLPVSEGL